MQQLQLRRTRSTSNNSWTKEYVKKLDDKNGSVVDFVVNDNLLKISSFPSRVKRGYVDESIRTLQNSQGSNHNHCNRKRESKNGKRRQKLTIDLDNLDNTKLSLLWLITGMVIIIIIIIIIQLMKTVSYNNFDNPLVRSAREIIITSDELSQKQGNNYGKFSVKVVTAEIEHHGARRLRSLFYSFNKYNLSPLSPIAVDDADYGDLLLQRQPERTIKGDDDDVYDTERNESFDDMDDDQNMNIWYYYRREELTEEIEETGRTCLLPDWTHDSYPNCNAFHELSEDGSINVRYLASATYRDTYMLEHYQQGENIVEKVVLKKSRKKRDLNYYILDKIRTEALMMERLTASKRITNMYGYCSTSILVEPANEITYDIVPEPNPSYNQRERGRIALNDLEKLENTTTDGIFSFNNFTAEEKLDIAIAMVEGVAEMHGFMDGTIVNDDLDPGQFMLSLRALKKGGISSPISERLILNDMNNAVFLEYDESQQQYCKYFIEYGGDYRAPEEYIGSYVDESVDIYPVGNLLFSLLTGLYPFYHLESQHIDFLQKIALEGQKPYINPKYAQRSKIERLLVQIMTLALQRNPEDRPSIFDILQLLHETKRLHYTGQPISDVRESVFDTVEMLHETKIRYYEKDSSDDEDEDEDVDTHEQENDNSDSDDEEDEEHVDVDDEEEKHVDTDDEQEDVAADHEEEDVEIDE